MLQVWDLEHFYRINAYDDIKEARYNKICSHELRMNMLDVQTMNSSGILF